MQSSRLHDSKECLEIDSERTTSNEMPEEIRKKMESVVAWYLGGIVISHSLTTTIKSCIHRHIILGSNKDTLLHTYIHTQPPTRRSAYFQTR